MREPIYPTKASSQVLHIIITQGLHQVEFYDHQQGKKDTLLISSRLSRLFVEQQFLLHEVIANYSCFPYHQASCDHDP